MFRGGVQKRSERFLDTQMPSQTWTQSRSWGAPGEPRAARSRPKASPGTPKTLQDPPDVLSERLRSTERLRTRLQIDFWLVLSCRAKTPMCLAYQFLQCFVGFERCKQRARATKTLENLRVSVTKIEPGSVRATQNRARAARLARQNAKKSREAQHFFWKRARTGEHSDQERRFWRPRASRGARPPGAGMTRTLKIF